MELREGNVEEQNDAVEAVTISVKHFAKRPEDLKAVDYENPERILLLFPSEKAVPLEKIDRSSFDRLIVLDGTWRQAKSMTKALGGHRFKHVKIQSQKTLFWRYQPFDEYHLSTIEAFYWFFRDFHAAYEPSVPYDGRYDNLLFYFKQQYELIQSVYQNSGRSFTGKKLDADVYIRRKKEKGAEGGDEVEEERGSSLRQ
ncbi:DTW domain-containing protein 1 [Borealophlyctis nickersoniae]|nr:DTW domain-containing protein 1 [Borealophlyctis nickersoniae]